MDKLRQMLIGAVAVSIMLPILLWTIINSATTGTRSDFSEVIQPVILLGLTASVIYTWARYLRGYIDHAIERKLKEIGKQ